jgi:histone deacetylase 1/2
MPIDAVLDDPGEEADLIPPDTRRHRRLLDSRRQADGELSDSDDEGEGGRTNHVSHRDPDSTSRTSGNEGAGGRKFGIMASASTAFPAGPSGHSTAARILSTGSATKMDVDDGTDTPTSNENGSTGEKSNGVHADEMVVDEPGDSNA